MDDPGPLMRPPWYNWSRIDRRHPIPAKTAGRRLYSRQYQPRRAYRCTPERSGSVLPRLLPSPPIRHRVLPESAGSIPSGDRLTPYASYEFSFSRSSYCPILFQYYVILQYVIRHKTMGTPPTKIVYNKSFGSMPQVIFFHPGSASISPAPLR